MFLILIKEVCVTISELLKNITIIWQNSIIKTVYYCTQISTTNFTDTSKPIYFMNAMLHAREWVTTPVAIYSIFRLVENLRSEDSDLLSDVDWIILPLVNPDGYEFSHTEVSFSITL